MSQQDSNDGRMMLSRRSALKLGLGTAVSLTVFGLDAKIVMAQDGQVLMVANPSFEQDWSPLRGGGVPYRWNSAWWASAMYFDEKGEIHPYVFTSWTGNADSTEWTFKIDPKAVFSDGSPITAADVKGSWEMATMPASKSQRINQVLAGVKGFDEVSGGDATELAGVATPDDATV